MCPVYMAYGMTYDQYWFGDPWMVEFYRESYLLKKREKNEEAWLQGLYIYRAVRAVVASAMGGRNEKYITNPLDFLPKTKLEKKQEEINKRKKLISYLNSWITPKDEKKSN